MWQFSINDLKHVSGKVLICWRTRTSSKSLSCRCRVDPISSDNLQQVLELVVQPAGARITCCNRWFSPLLDITPISSSLLDIGVFGAGDKRTSNSISTPATTTTYIHNRLLPSALSPLPLKINNNKMPSEKFLFSSKSDFPLRYRLTLPWWDSRDPIQ